MRIPPSAIVMGLVTAVPIGLGIREALTAKTAASLGQRDVGEYDRHGDRAGYEAELARAKVEREARAAQQLAQLDQLFGQRPAAMGSLFGSVQLGEVAGPDQLGQLRKHIDDATRDGFLSVTLDASESALDAVQVDINAEDGPSDACATLDSKLVAAWGHSVAGVWVDPTTHQRATLADGTSCRLHFDRYLEPAQLVAQLPFAAVGGAADELAQQLGERADVGPDSIAWTLPGVGAGRGATSVEAFLEQGRITGFTLTSNADFESLIAIRDALAAKLKAAPVKTSEDARDSEGQVWEWRKGRVPVTITDNARGTFTITVGEQAWH